jgi:hypothetical protein
MPDIDILIPFSKRVTAVACVFNCMFIASPQGAQVFVFGIAAPIAALQLEYAQLVVEYRLLIQSETATRRADLFASIDRSVVTIGNLVTTLSTITATGDAGIQLAGMKIVAANALTQIKIVQIDE